MKRRPLQLSVRPRARAQAREGRAPRAAWRPLTLCWRRPSPRAPVTRISPRAQHFHQNFHTQLHVHLSAAAVAAPRAARDAAARGASLIARGQAVGTRIDLRQITQQCVHTAMSRERVRRETVTVSEPAPARLRHLSASPVHHANPRVKPSSLVSIARAIIPVTRIDAAPAPPASAALAPPGNPPHATVIHRAAERAAPTERRPPTAPALVWQKVAAPVSFAGSGEHAVDHPLALAPIARSQAPHAASGIAAAAMQSQLQNIARETQRALLLDPAVTERLAEDVLRKVDKRLRIERERRGL